MTQCPNCGRFGGGAGVAWPVVFVGLNGAVLPDGRELPLRGQAAEVLAVLVEARGAMVPGADLAARVGVTRKGLHVAIFHLRRAFEAADAGYEVVSHMQAGFRLARGE